MVCPDHNHRNQIEGNLMEKGLKVDSHQSVGLTLDGLTVTMAHHAKGVTGLSVGTREILLPHQVFSLVIAVQLFTFKKQPNQVTIRRTLNSG